MADLRGRSRRSQQQRNSRSTRLDRQSPPVRHSRSDGAIASRRLRGARKRGRRPASQPLTQSGWSSAPSVTPPNGSDSRETPPSRTRPNSRSSREPSRRRSRAERANREPIDPNAGSIVLRQPGAIVRSNASVRSRDGRRIPLGPDPRRRSQVGAYASAFGGRRSRQSGATAASRTLVPRSPKLTAFPGAKAAGTDRPVQRLSPRPVASPSPRKVRRKRPRRPASPWVYGIRLLILGVGISAIAGTVLSALNPSRQELVADEAASAGSDASALNNLMTAPESGRSLMSALQLNREMSGLSQELQDIVDNYPELEPGIFVYDLDTGNYIDLNGTIPFAAASTIKVAVLIAFFQDVEVGTLSYDEVLTMEAEDLATGSGDMQFQPIGTEYTALDVASAMIIISDNTATNMLIRRMGGAAVLNERFRSWGLQYTAINNLLPDLEGTNRTSPQELVELMTMVSREELVSGRSRDRILHIMNRTQTDTLLPQGLSSEASIFHKTGDIGSMLGDVGLVDVPNGKRYAIAVHVARPHNDGGAREVINQVSNRVYEAMEDDSIDIAPSGLSDTDSQNDGVEINAPEPSGSTQFDAAPEPESDLE